MTPKQKSWSYSALSTYEQCPRRYKYAYLDRLPQPPAPALEHGKRVHKLAEDYVAGKLTALPRELGKFVSLFEDLRAIRATPEHEIVLSDAWAPVDPKSADRWLKCVIDASAVYVDNTADIVDYKTGKRYDGHAKQMQLYSTALMSVHPNIMRVTTRLWYLDSGEEVKDTMLSAAVPNLQRTWAAKAGKMFADAELPPRPGRLCGWCPFRRSIGGPCPENQ